MRTDQQTTLAADYAAPYLNRSTTPQQSSIIYRLGADQAHERIKLPTTAPAPAGSSAVGLLMGLDSVPLYNDHPHLDSATYVQRVKYYSDKIIFYPQRLHSAPIPQRDEKRIKNLTRGKFNGYISRSSGQLIRKRLETWIKSVYQERERCKGVARVDHSHIVFATLTLPADQIHGDNEIKRKCLMPFFQQLKRLHGIQEYFWSAEPMRNGNLHFHILTDRYIDGKALDQLWNNASDNLGYLGRYMAKHGNVNPPSTQIRQCPPNMSLVKYVLKYVSKQPEIRCSLRMDQGKRVQRVSLWQSEEIKGGVIGARQMGLDLSSDDITIKNGKVYQWYERRKIEGRSWGMSKGLLTLDVYGSEVSYRVQDIKEILKWDSSVKWIKRDHAEIFYCNTVDVLMRNDPVVLQDYRRYYIKIYDRIYRGGQAELKQVPKVIRLDQPPDIRPVFYEQKRLLFA